MVHVKMHLLDEALEDSPVHMKWMCQFGRYLGTLKHFLRNRDKSEGSIAVSYVMEEALAFVARYFEDVSNEVVQAREFFVFQSEKCVPYGKMYPARLDEKSREMAEWYILTN